MVNNAAIPINSVKNDLPRLGEIERKKEKIIIEKEKNMDKKKEIINDKKENMEKIEKIEMNDITVSKNEISPQTIMKKEKGLVNTNNNSTMDGDDLNTDITSSSITLTSYYDIDNIDDDANVSSHKRNSFPKKIFKMIFFRNKKKGKNKKLKKNKNKNTLKKMESTLSLKAHNSKRILKKKESSLSKKGIRNLYQSMEQYKENIIFPSNNLQNSTTATSNPNTTTNIKEDLKRKISDESLKTKYKKKITPTTHQFNNINMEYKFKNIDNSIQSINTSGSTLDRIIEPYQSLYVTNNVNPTSQDMGNKSIKIKKNYNLNKKKSSIAKINITPNIHSIDITINDDNNGMNDFK